MKKAAQEEEHSAPLPEGLSPASCPRCCAARVEGGGSIIRMVEPDHEAIGLSDDFGAANLEGREVSPPNRRSPTETSQDPVLW